MSDRETMIILSAFSLAMSMNDYFPEWSRWAFLILGGFLLIYIKFTKNIVEVIKK